MLPEDYFSNHEGEVFFKPRRTKYCLNRAINQTPCSVNFAMSSEQSNDLFVRTLFFQADLAGSPAPSHFSSLLYDSTKFNVLIAMCSLLNTI